MPDNNLRIKITRDIAQKITEIGRKYKLKLVVIYGNRLEYHNFKAYAFRAYMDSEFSNIFKGKEIDIKSLHRVDPFFRYQVMRDSILIYGNLLEYHNFKAYAFRAYMDSKDLLQIEKILSQKTISYLRQLHG